MIKNLKKKTKISIECLQHCKPFKIVLCGSPLNNKTTGAGMTRIEADINSTHVIKANYDIDLIQ